MSKLGKKLVSMLPGKEVLHNRGVLYAMCLIALMQIIMYGNVRDFNSIITLLIVGFLASFFSKNMIVVLGLAISVTYILNFVPSRMISEGAENMKEGIDEPVSSENPTDSADSKNSTNASVSEIADSASSSAESATAPSPEEKKKMLYDNLKNDFKDFQKIQDSILTGMKDIDPLLAKAESFISKFEHYSKTLKTDAQ